jgi:hypothetical protein
MGLEGSGFFPATPDVIDPRASIRFRKQEAVWTTVISKSEYASGPVKQLTMVSAPKEDSAALELTWTAP